MADRGHAPPGNPRGHAKETWLCRPRRPEQCGEANDLRWQRRASLWPEVEGGRERADARLLGRPAGELAQRVRTGGARALQSALRVRPRRLMKPGGHPALQSAAPRGAAGLFFVAGPAVAAAAIPP